MEKPKFLYHGSWNKNILEFEPRIAQNDSEPRVYASHNPLVAFSFIPKYNGWMSVGVFEDNGAKNYYIMFTEDCQQVAANDLGGALYTLPSDTFENNPGVNFGDWEWYSKVPVKPIGKEVFVSWREEFKKKGILIFYTKQNIYEEFKKLKPEDKAKFLVKQKEKGE